MYALDGRRVLRRLTLTGRNRFPVWSPDGPERLTTAADGAAHVPESWSPDGRYLAYAVQTTSPRGEYALWVLSLADGKAAAFGDVTSMDPIGAAFSPDGRWIACARASGDDISAVDRGVFVQPFPATGTVFQAPRQLVDFHPLWSRDGKELMFLASTTARQMAAMQVSMSGGGLAFGAPTRFPASVTGDKLSRILGRSTFCPTAG